MVVRNRISTKSYWFQSFRFIPSILPHRLWGKLGLSSQCLKWPIPLQHSTPSVSLPTSIDSIWWRHHKCHLSRRNSPNFTSHFCRKRPWRIYMFSPSLRCVTNANTDRRQLHFPMSHRPQNFLAYQRGSHHKSRKKVKFTCSQLLSLFLPDSCIGLLVSYKTTTASQQPQQEVFIPHSLICSHFGWPWFRQWF